MAKKRKEHSSPQDFVEKGKEAYLLARDISRLPQYRGRKQSEYEKAIKYFELAWNKGSLEGAYYYGACSILNRGVSQLTEEERKFQALSAFRFGAEKGDPKATVAYFHLCGKTIVSEQKLAELPYEQDPRMPSYGAHGRKSVRPVLGMVLPRTSPTLTPCGAI
ncbi:MAG: hypothetical protein PHW76_06995 [Alphaproteobacteria bacterium]|nr:hypothetical protein [Alphaproteobacteria bacterium]